MKKLFLLAGLPAVGKSTISQILSKKIGAKIVDIDDFKKTDVDPALVTNQIDPPEQRWGYYQKALQYVLGLFSQEVSTVIMDEVFHLSSLRARLEVICEREHIDVLWVEVRCPYNIVEKRLRSTDRKGHILSTEEALRMHLLFEEIFEEFSTNTPNHVIINNEGDIDEDGLIENVLKKIKKKIIRPAVAKANAGRLFL